jgi:hypothetical protein
MTPVSRVAEAKPCRNQELVPHRNLRRQPDCRGEDEAASRVLQPQMDAAPTTETRLQDDAIRTGPADELGNEPLYGRLIAEMHNHHPQCPVDRSSRGLPTPLASSQPIGYACSTCNTVFVHVDPLKPAARA